MAFSFNNWGQISATGNLRNQLLQNGSLLGAPGFYSYISNVDTMATITAVDYFSPVGATLAVGDLIYVYSSDLLAEIFTVLAVDINTGNLIIGNSTGPGDVNGPGSSTNTALARWNGTSGTVLSDSLVLLDNSGNLTGVNSMTTQQVNYQNPAKTFSTIVKSAAVTQNYTYTLPIATPAVTGYVLTSTTAGIMSWAPMEGGTWVDQTTTPVTLAANTAYVADTAGLLTFNVPAVVPFGTVFEIGGKGAGGWLVQFNTGQVGNLNSTPTSSAGSFSSTNQWNSIKILCVTANTTFVVLSSSGVITVA